MKSRTNPYANRLKKQITIRLDNSTIDYFKKLAEETGFSCQALINLYLRDCTESHKRLKVDWIESGY
ncbi:MAG: BrnA antitoxin family protein [Bacteroidales bacterium]|nr:BrnA antitoxin family protein [Bacteroidales bacterium]